MKVGLIVRMSAAADLEVCPKRRSNSRSEFGGMLARTNQASMSSGNGSISSAQPRFRRMTAPMQTTVPSRMPRTMSAMNGDMITRSYLRSTVVEAAGWANSTLTNKSVDLCVSALRGDIFGVWRLELDTNVGLSQMKAQTGKNVPEALNAEAKQQVGRRQGRNRVCLCLDDKSLRL